jgi:hypothetical protein
MKLNKFAELCIHTRCKAFVDSTGEVPAEEWMEELSTSTLPLPSIEPRFIQDETFKIRGTFHLIHAEPSGVAELKIVCDGFDELAHTYHVFYDPVGNHKDGDSPNWIVYTPYIEPDWK